MGKFLLAIDIGTSACKVALFTLEGEVVAQRSAEYNVYYPQPGWVEQDPNEWWQATSQAIRALLNESQVRAEDIAGIGVDGQSWSAIAVDRQGEVLCRTPIWMDTRAAGICDELKQSIGEDVIFDLCGNPLQPAYTLPKILWYKKYAPEVYKKTYQILQSNSFIVYRLTGRFSQDISQGYGLHCFDMKRGRWDEKMAALLGIDISMLPDILPSHAVVGYVTDDAARQCGLAAGTPVVAGGLDAACGTLGAGVIHTGQTQEQGGQAGGMSICTDIYEADPRLILGYHVVPDKWLLQGGTVGGGGVTRWFEQQFYEHKRNVSPSRTIHAFDVMNEEAELVPAGSEGLLFLPYMAGERSPIWDQHAKGVYYGLDYSKTRGHMVRASMEGVAYSLQHNLDVAAQAGVSVNEIHAMGGAANSLLWTQMKADVTGKTIYVPSSDTATTLGAAILAGIGVGVYSSFEEAVSRTVHMKRKHVPNLDNREVYQRGYHTYLMLYDQLKHLMKEQGE